MEELRAGRRAGEDAPAGRRSLRATVCGRRLPSRIKERLAALSLSRTTCHFEQDATSPSWGMLAAAELVRCEDNFGMLSKHFQDSDQVSEGEAVAMLQACGFSAEACAEILHEALMVSDDLCGDAGGGEEQQANTSLSDKEHGIGSESLAAEDWKCRWDSDSPATLPPGSHLHDVSIFEEQ